MSQRISRRAILRGLGGTALALPFLASWRGESGWGVFNVPEAKADTGTPKRVVFFVSCLGSLYEYFTPRNTSADGTSFELAEIMAPLAPYKDKLTVLTGVNMASVHYQYTQNNDQGFAAHDFGSAHVLSSILHERSEIPWGPNWTYARPKGPSIDQAIARRIGANSRFPSLIVGDAPPEGRGVFVGNADGNDLPRDKDPIGLYNRVFKDFEGDPEAQERRRKGKLAAVSNALPAYRHLSTRLSARDKLILDQHMDSLSAMEKRLQLTSTCTKPDAPTGEYFINGEVRNPNAPPAGPYADLFELGAIAMGCDMTRVMVFGMNGNGAAMSEMIPRLGELGLGGEDFHSITHAEPGETNRIEGLKDLHVWRMGQLAKFVEKLATTVDVDGRMMLDNTCIVHVSEMITGAHDMLPTTQRAWMQQTGRARPLGLPVFLLGGLGGSLKTNLHLDLSKGDTYGSELGKYSHGELYLTIARAMGIGEADMPTFGQAEVCKRVISEILA